MTPETLWLRLLGRGKTQDQAVRELLELPQGNAFREMEINNILETEDREVFMTLSQTYQEWKEATKREGQREAKLESIPRLLALGLSVEQIAQALDLDLEQVRQAARE
ncbi:MAG: hypothetical protein GPI99_16860 [Microcystis aeruginosa W13-15]|nr:hypothetical protein [Microcystis aeruginosa W13-16]NCQ75293.1 hypothetical protein [Microcystis aeruginosa W13-13]NCQ79718.1 hypothetical protein [Microcystis aeruginosa W13-15]